MDQFGMVWRGGQIKILCQYGKISIHEGNRHCIWFGAMECYGLVGMAHATFRKDLRSASPRNFERGVDIQFGEESISCISW